MVDATDAGWSSSVARWAHNPEVAGSNPVPATKWNGPRRFSGGRFHVGGNGRKSAGLGARAIIEGGEPRTQSPRRVGGVNGVPRRKPRIHGLRRGTPLTPP